MLFGATDLLLLSPDIIVETSDTLTGVSKNGVWVVTIKVAEWAAVAHRDTLLSYFANIDKKLVKRICNVSRVIYGFVIYK